jgi:hypothetical protein
LIDNIARSVFRGVKKYALDERFSKEIALSPIWGAIKSIEKN